MSFFACAALWAIHGCGAPSGDAGETAVVVPLGPNVTGGDDANDGVEPDGGGDVVENDNTPPPPANDNATDDGDSGDDGSDAGGSNDNVTDEPDDAPFRDACAAVSGRTFIIADRTLAFDGARFNWITSGGLSMGIFVCDGFSLLGVSTTDEQIVGSYDPRSDTVTWQGTIYLPSD